MTYTAVQALEFLAQQPQLSIRWRGPLTVSTILHALLFLLFPLIWEMHREVPLEPVRVLEVNVMGWQDLALKGTGNDFGRGPLPKDSPLATPPKMKGRPVHGTTPKMSRSLSRGRSRTAPPAELAPLTAAGPIFAGREMGVASGVGREKVYLAPSATRLAAKSNRAASGGDGLVGVPGGPVSLRSRRGGGGGGGGSGGFLMGGEGSIHGGDILERRGTPIVETYRTLSDKVVTAPTRTTEIPPLSDDAFFSLRGPLSHRKILKIKLPRYPRWAEESGVEAQVSVRLFVTPNGRVKSNLYVENTSGYPELDTLVLDCIKQILFAPLSGDVLREEWGIATFNFKLQRQGRGG
ncbi:MAG: TonB family protein [Elusimicrobia bacterium]|nr:TonB family protein [Elusimicrobiota bacterium]